MDSEGNVFRKVVGFSNGEFDKFSTASLITRSTNDIQQIQLLTVMILRMVLYAPIMAIGGMYESVPYKCGYVLDHCTCCWIDRIGCSSVIFRCYAKIQDRTGSG